MATKTATMHAPFGAVTILRMVNALTNVKTAIVKWNASRKTREMLYDLSDAQLNDVGLTRADIAKF